MGCCFAPPRSASLEDLAEYAKGGQPAHGKGRPAAERAAEPGKRSAADGAGGRAAQDLTPMAQETAQTPFKVQCRRGPRAVKQARRWPQRQGRACTATSAARQAAASVIPSSCMPSSHGVLSRVLSKVAQAWALYPMLTRSGWRAHCVRDLDAQTRLQVLDFQAWPGAKVAAHKP